MDGGSSTRSIIEAAPELAAHLSQFVVPIFSRRGGDASQIGTGFLVDYKGHSFLITAAHVLDEIGKIDGRNVCLYYDRRTFADLDGFAFKTKSASGRRDDDHLDVGVMMLRGACVPPFEDIGKRAMSSSKLSEAMQDGSYFVVGFPASKGKVDHAKNAHISGFGSLLIAKGVDASTYEKLNLLAASSIVMPYKKQTATDLQGNRINPIAFRGMSGSPVFVVPTRISAHDDSKIEMAGIFIEHRKTANVLVATRTRIARDGMNILLAEQTARAERNKSVREP